MVGEALTADAFCNVGNSFRVTHSQGRPVIVPEIKFREIAMQVLLATMLVNALHSPFEDRKHAFNRIGVNVTANILPVRVRDSFVRLKF